jgi:hypothetical protein
VDTATIDTQVPATLDCFYARNDRNKYLADNAAAVLVLPNITKAGAGVSPAAVGIKPIPLDSI